MSRKLFHLILPLLKAYGVAETSVGSAVPLTLLPEGGAKAAGCPPEFLGLATDFSGQKLHPRTPFCSLPWTQLLAETALPQDSSPLLCHTPELLLPLVQTGQARRLAALTSYYTPLFEPLTELSGAALQAALDALLEKLSATRPRWSTIDLRPLDPESEFFSAWAKTMRKHGYWVGSYSYQGNWVADTANLDGAAYMAKRAKLRGTIRRARAKLEAEAAVEIRVTTVPGTELDADIAAFSDIYERSWREAEPYPSFIEGLCRLAADAGWLRLGVMRIDGLPAAAQLWLVYDGIAYIFKIAYDETYARHSVGSILTMHMASHILDTDRVHLIDYLVGDDEYKKRWMDRRRERKGLIAFHPRTLDGFTGAAHHFGGQALRKLRSVRWLQS